MEQSEPGNNPTPKTTLVKANQIVVWLSLFLSLISGSFGIGYGLVTKFSTTATANENKSISTTSKKTQDSVVPKPTTIKASPQARTTNTPASGLSPEPLGTSDFTATELNRKPRVRVKSMPVIGDGITDTPEELRVQREKVRRWNAQNNNLNYQQDW